MKKLILYLIIICSSIACQEISPLQPPSTTTSIVGVWALFGYQCFNMPAWYVKKHKLLATVVPPDTIYGPFETTFTNVNSYSITADGNYSVEYVKQTDGITSTFQQPYLTKTGTWSVADSVVSLSTIEKFPGKLTYSASKNQLITDRFKQTSILMFNNNPLDIDTVTYEIRIFYRKFK